MESIHFLLNKELQGLIEDYNGFVKYLNMPNLTKQFLHIAVGIDVARALGYTKASQAIIDHCKGIRKLGIPSEGGEQETNVIPEEDTYRLIVKAADQSRNP